MNSIEHPATQYAIDVSDRARIAGSTERMACERHLSDLQRQGDPDFPWVYDESKADRIYRWFERNCRHVEGPLAGQFIQLLPFQKFDLGVMFGWVHRDTGLRRFEKAYIQEARKNAKTTILSGVALYLMVGDREESPRVYCAAVDKGQARLLYEASMAMARKSNDISKRLLIRDYKISHKTRGGQLSALSKDTKNKDGLNPSGAIIDEYHAHPTSEIYDLIWSAWGQRAQALMTIITTAGFDTESPCYREYTYCKNILTGAVSNERYFVMIRELDQGDDEHDPANWIKANPLRAATPEGLAKLQEQHDEAHSSRDPAKMRTFRVKNLNIWVHGGEASYMGAHMTAWDNLAVSPDEFAALTEDLLCLVGADLSKKIDLTADGFVFALPDGRVAVKAHGFMPEETVAAHESTDKREYRAWVDAGWMTATPGAVTDYRRVQAHIQDEELEHGYSVHEFCFDPYNATQFATEMADEGYTCVEIRQGVQTLSEPTKLFRDLVVDGRLVHDGSPLLRWCVANAVQVQDSNENIKISKKNVSDVKRIDLLAAILNALVRYPALLEAVAAGQDIGV
jgi:phage terminase large subunit-like protein